jgi:hypothetical protein
MGKSPDFFELDAQVPNDFGAEKFVCPWKSSVPARVHAGDVLDKFIWASPGSPGLVHFLAVIDEAAEAGASSGDDYPFFNRDLMSLTGQVSQAGMTLTRLLSDVLMSA